jgi:hypothetical protein
MKVHVVRLLVTMFAAATSATLTPLASEAAADAGGCSFHFWKEPEKQNDAILVTGFADCRPAPQRFHVSLTLERLKRGDGWEVRGAKSDSQIPDPRLNIGAWAPCEDGAWQAVANVWLRARDEEFKFVKDTHTAIIRC